MKAEDEARSWAGIGFYVQIIYSTRRVMLPTHSFPVSKSNQLIDIV